MVKRGWVANGLDFERAAQPFEIWTYFQQPFEIWIKTSGFRVVQFENGYNLSYGHS